MGRKGPAGHMRRYAAPVHWPISPKENFWAVKPLPGPHPERGCLPIAYVVRDILGYASTVREVKQILNAGSIKIDGRPRMDYRYPVGVMDVVEITPLKAYYRILPHPVTKLALHSIPKDEAEFKLCRVENKSTQRKGVTQLNLHDGRSMLLKQKKGTQEKEGEIHTNEVLRITLPKPEVLEVIKPEKGAYAVVLGGKNTGNFGKIIEVQAGFRKKRSLVTLENAQGEKFQTSLNYVFAIGAEKPVISLPARVPAT